MKINRLAALAASAMLVVGTMSAFALRTFAQTAPATPAPDCAADQADDAAGAEGQAEDETDAAAGAAECDEGQADTQDAETEAEAANDAVAEQEPAPAGTPAITAEAAQQIAEAHLNGATATRVELEDEDGRLVYGVEFDTDAGVTEVQVDAMTGEVVATETGDD